MIPSSQDDLGVGSSISKLLRVLDAGGKEVVSEYDVRMTPEGREKHFMQKFNVPKLEYCATKLHIKTKNEEGKKLFKKGLLVKKILSRIESLFPQYCKECNTEYAYDLADEPKYHCFHCKNPAHNCQAFQDLIPDRATKLPMGFIWLCDTCFN